MKSFIAFVFCIYCTVSNNIEAANTAFTKNSDDAFDKECLDQTNIVRDKRANVIHLLAGKDPAEIAALKGISDKRCQEISVLDDLTSAHALLPHGYGENIYWIAKTNGVLPPVCKEAVDYWSSEETAIDWAHLAYKKEIGHFTQLVWKSTLAMSCTRCSSAKNDVSGYTQHLIVCNYSPQGNKIADIATEVIKKTP